MRGRKKYRKGNSDKEKRSCALQPWLRNQQQRRFQFFNLLCQRPPLPRSRKLTSAHYISIWCWSLTHMEIAGQVCIGTSAEHASRERSHRICDISSSTRTSVPDD